MLRNWYSRSAIVGITKRLLSDKLALVFLTYIILFYIAGIFGPFFAQYDYRVQDFTALREGPSWAHWFGTDLLGRDVFTRSMYAAQFTVIITGCVLVFGGFFLPVTLGLLSGYLGGKVDYVIMRVGEVMTAVPAFFMILFLTFTVRPKYEEFFYGLGDNWYWIIQRGFMDMSLLLVVFSIFFWVGGARVIRSQVFSLREMPYIDAARVLGASTWRIIPKHILPNLLPIVVQGFFITLAGIVVIDLGLSFLGVGVRPPNPTFGAMIADINSSQLVNKSPHLLYIPGTIVGLFIFSLTYVGMKLSHIVSTFESRTDK